MTQLVIDSSVAIKWFVAEPNSLEALAILTQSRNGAIVFLAPDLIYAELGNIVWKKQINQGLSASDARLILQDFQQLRFAITPTKILLNDAYEIATIHRRTVYDALYIALSLRENCQFVTADERLVNSIGSVFPNVVKLANWT